MRAIRKRPGERPEVIEVENTLEGLQREVGGYIETVTVSADLCLICDEEGLLKGKQYNTRICNVPFVGTILAVGVNGDEFTDVKDPEMVMRLVFKEGC